MQMQGLSYTNRRKFLKTTAALGIGMMLPKFPALAKGKGLTLTILHSNDWHSRIEPFPDDGGKFALQGGAAQRAELIKSIRAEGNPVLLLDSGDIVQGTAYFNLFGGELEYKLMSEMGYNAATLGNHDFDAGLKGLANQTANARFPIICTNYDFSKTHLNGRFKPYHIFNFDNVKVGVLGLGIELEGLVPPNLYSGLVINDALSAANNTAALLRKKGCTYIICLSHLGYKYQNDRISDVKIAAGSKGIDLILGGHTHTFMDQPEEVLNQEGKKVLVSQSGWGGIRLGRINVGFGNAQTPVSTASLSYKISK